APSTEDREMEDIDYPALTERELDLLARHGNTPEIVAAAQAEQERRSPRHQAILRIARDVLGFETLDVRRSDRLDFREVGVVELRQALEAAYDAGRNSRG